MAIQNNQNTPNIDKSGAPRPFNPPKAIDPKVKAALETGDLSALAGNGMEMAGIFSALSALLQRSETVDVMAAEMEKATAVLTELQGAVGAMKDPKAVRAHMASDRSWAEKKRVAMNETAVGVVNEARGLIHDSPLGWIVSAAVTAGAGWFLGEKLGLIGGEDSAGGDLPFDK